MTTQMVRKQIYIQKRQDELLKRLSKARGVSEAEIIRQAINHEVSGVTPSSQSADRGAWDELIKFLEYRKSLGTTGEPYRWNREEIYEERESRWLHPKDKE